MLKSIVYGVTGIVLVVLSYNLIYTPAAVISSAFSFLGAPDNVLQHSLIAFSLSFVGLFIAIIIFLILRATKKEFDVRSY